MPTPRSARPTAISRHRLLALLALLLALPVLAAACAQDEALVDEAEADAADDAEDTADDVEAGSAGELTIGLFNWAENVAVSNMWALLLEGQGYDVELELLDKTPNFAGVAGGELDVSLELWLPTTDAHLVDEFDDAIVVDGPWYEGTSLGVAVPTYVEAETMTDLVDDPAFAEVGQIVGIDAGASLTGLIDDALEVYGLDDVEQVESSEPAMLTELDVSYGNEEPVAVAMWDPHWAWSAWDIRYLEDPENVFGDPEEIFFFHRVGFDEDFPEVLGWLQNWFMTGDELSGLMAEIEETGDPVEGAETWIAEHRDLVEEWID